MNPRHAIHLCWQGLYPPGQTALRDRSRRAITDALQAGRGQPHTVVILDATPAAGSTTLTALLATVAHALHGTAPSLIDDHPRGDLLSRLPDQYPQLPTRTANGPDPADVARLHARRGENPLLLADLSPQTANSRLAFLAAADAVIVVRPPHPSADAASRNLRAWLADLGEQHGRPRRPLLDVSNNTAKRGQLTLPQDASLRSGPVDAGRLKPAIIQAALEVLGAIQAKLDPV